MHFLVPKRENICSRQDLKNKEEIWSWISSGEYIYICGNASKMAINVENTLNRIAIEVGKLDEQQSRDFFKNLHKTRHFQKDVY